MNSSDQHFAVQHLPHAPVPDARVPDDSAPEGRAPGERSSAGHSPGEHSPGDGRRPWVSGSDVSSSLQSLLGTVVIAVFVITFIVQAFQIPSPSMENTLLVGDYLLVNKLCYGGGSVGDYFMPYLRVRRGDIVVFHYPVNPAQHFVKRVIGVPGDRVRLVNKRVFVNGTLMPEPFVQYIAPDRQPYRDDFPRTDSPAFGVTARWWQEMRTLVEDKQLIIPEDNYFVLGDNRDDSQDSRYWG